MDGILQNNDSRCNNVSHFGVIIENNNISDEKFGYIKGVNITKLSKGSIYMQATNVDDAAVDTGV